MTMTPNSLPSASSRTRIVATIRLTTSSRFMTRRISLRPSWRLTVSSLVSYLPVMSSTLITRLASPAMADAVGQPAGAAAHGLGQVIAAVGLGVGQQVADLRGQDLDGREVAEGEVDAHVVVVDRLGQMDHGDAAAAGGQLLLEELELVGRLQRVVAADGDQGVHAQRDQGVVDGPQRSRPAADPSGGRGRRSSLPGLARAVPMMMPWLLRVRRSTLWSMRM